MFERTDKVPAWLRKPVHKKEVVASDKGWVVKDTGELLVRVPNLITKIAEYFGTAPVLVKEPEVKVDEPEIEPEVKVEVKVEDPELTPELEVKVEEPAIELEVKVEDETSVEQKKSWMNNGSERKLVDAVDVDALLAEGWVMGRGKNK